MALWGQVPGALGAVPGSLGAGPAALHTLGPMPGVWGVLGRFFKCGPSGPQMHTYFGGRLLSEGGANAHFPEGKDTVGLEPPWALAAAYLWCVVLRAHRGPR